jgi:hypothetical protein
MLTDELRDVLNRRNTLLREHQRANDTHRAASWMRSRERSVIDDRPPEPGLDL